VTVDNVGNGRGNDIDINGNGKKDTTVVSGSGNGRGNDIRVDPDRGDTVIVRGSGNGSRNTIRIDEAPGGTVIVDASSVGKNNKVVIDRAPGETVKIINSANGENNNIVIRDVDENGKPIRKNDRHGDGKGSPDVTHDDAAHHVTLKDRQALRTAPGGRLVKPAGQLKGSLPGKVSDPRVTTPKFPGTDPKPLDPRVTTPPATFSKLPDTARVSAALPRQTQARQTPVAGTTGRAPKK
jgi:hypothetical protein